MLVIGLSGGIGSGKTTIGKQFEQLGITVIDADDIAREVVQKGASALDEIVGRFGHDILLEDGALNRAKLRKIIFNAPSEKDWLEQLTHPKIIQRTQDKVNASTSAYTIYISPLLIERGIGNFVNRLLIVDCEEQQQIKRTTARDNNSPDLVEAIMNSQCTRSERLAKADDIILNDGDIKNLQIKVLALHHQYLELTSQ